MAKGPVADPTTVLMFIILSFWPHCDTSPQNFMFTALGVFWKKPESQMKTANWTLPRLPQFLLIKRDTKDTRLSCRINGKVWSETGLGGRTGSQPWATDWKICYQLQGNDTVKAVLRSFSYEDTKVMLTISVTHQESLSTLVCVECAFFLLKHLQNPFLLNILSPALFPSMLACSQSFSTPRLLAHCGESKWNPWQDCVSCPHANTRPKQNSGPLSTSRGRKVHRGPAFFLYRR